MEIDKIRRLFSPYDSKSVNSTKVLSEQRGVSTRPVQVSADSGEAVRLSGELRSEIGDSPQEAKIRRIKAQVDSGSYKPDSREVAKALIQDLAIV